MGKQHSYKVQDEGSIPSRRTMSIRLRRIEGEMVALCAAFSEPKIGDLYLDDAHHYALSCKFARDYSHNFPNDPKMGDEINDALARKECKCPTCTAP